MFKHIAAVALTLLVMMVPARAQSTDPMHPDPWPGTASGRGINRQVTYYYRLASGVGPMNVHVDATAAHFSTGVTVDFNDEAGNPIARGGAIATSGGGSGDNRFNLAEPHTLQIAVHLDENCGNWRVSINAPPAPAATPTPSPTPHHLPVRPHRTDGARPDGSPWPGVVRPHGTPAPAPMGGVTTFPVSGISGAGDGADHTTTFTVDAGPGDVTITVTARARTFSTAVTAGLWTASGDLRREVGAIATSDASRTETGTVHLTERGTYTLRVHVDGNVGPYTVQVTGAVNR